MKLCERCENKFNPKVSYQIYCGEICRSAATKQKILESKKFRKRSVYGDRLDKSYLALVL